MQQLRLIGTVFTGLVIDENEQFYFVQKNGISFRLLKSEGEHQLGDAVEGFAYLNLKNEESFTTQVPSIYNDHYAFCEVVDTRRDLGAFVSIGLPNKDLVVSMDELPDMKNLWPKKGDQLMVTLVTDEKDRMWGKLAEDSYFQALKRQAGADMQNQNVTAHVYRVKKVGTYVITTENYLGFIHPSERMAEPRLGEIVNARVIGVRTDGILNLSLKPRNYEVISDDAQMILTFLNQAADGRIPFSDKSTPEEIKAKFGISKAQFKRALGNLMKEKKIRQEDGWTHLIEEKNAGSEELS